jgi:hypothetical protein
MPTLETEYNYFEFTESITRPQATKPSFLSRDEWALFYQEEHHFFSAHSGCSIAYALDSALLDFARALSTGLSTCKGSASG